MLARLLLRMFLISCLINLLPGGLYAANIAALAESGGVASGGAGLHLRLSCDQSKFSIPGKTLLGGRFDLTQGKVAYVRLHALLRHHR
jgi:hypothetical protein